MKLLKEAKIIFTVFMFLSGFLLFRTHQTGTTGRLEKMLASRVGAPAVTASPSTTPKPTTSPEPHRAPSVTGAASFIMFAQANRSVMPDAESSAEKDLWLGVMIEALTECPKDPSACFEFGGKAERGGHMEDAIRLYELGCFDVVADEDSCLALGKIVKADRAGEARRLCKRGDARSCMIVAGGRARIGDLNGMKEYLRYACETADAMACFDLGLVINGKERQAVAVKCKTGDIRSCGISAGAAYGAGNKIGYYGYMEVACDYGDFESCDELGESLSESAIRKVSNQCNAGNAISCIKLAGREETAGNWQKALDLWRRAYSLSGCRKCRQ